MSTSIKAIECGSQLWKFSYAWWGNGRVEQICLNWQTNSSLDVSFLVWCIWIELKYQHILSPNEIEEAVLLVKEWRQMFIEPARTARKNMRKFDPDLSGFNSHDIYDDLRSVELKAEMREQLLLLDWWIETSRTSEKSKKQNITATNGHTYLKIVLKNVSNEDRISLEHLYESAPLVIQD